MLGKTDTNPVIDAFLVKGYRLMPTSQKIKLTFEMSEMIIKMAKLGIEHRNPGISLDEMKKRLGAIILGRELSIRVNNWDPEKEGC